MRTSRITIKNLFGITEKTLDGKSVELTGPKGAGKTSVLDAIRYALTNRSDRDYIIRQGADEGEIIIETDTGLSIARKSRTAKADAITVRDGKMLQTRPAQFLNGIFTPLQLNPVEFTQMDRQEKNRVILSLIEFDWDINWIKDQFGEIPQGIDYSKHILEVLSDIQADNGVYYQSRQNINRDIRNNLAFIAEIALAVPAKYDAARWEKYDLGEKYREMGKIKDDNARIVGAKAFKARYQDQLRGIKADRDIAVAAEERLIAAERESLHGTIARLKAEIKAAEDRLAGLGDKLTDKTRAIDAEYREKLASLDADTKRADQYAEKEPVPVDGLAEEITYAETMIKHLNEYRRMRGLQDKTDQLVSQSEELTRKIDLARELPAQILATAKIPIEGLTVVDGIPLINGLPISNLSDGELLELCVDVSVSRPGQLEIILVDGAERLDTASRERLYAKCREKGLQLIATRVTDGTDMEVVYLD